MNVKEICEAWIEDGREDDCFWEGWPECPTPEHSLTPNMVLEALAARDKQVREAALRESAHLMPRYFGVWSSTGVHIGVWDDGETAAKVLEEYPGGVARDLIDADEILALITKDQTNG